MICRNKYLCIICGVGFDNKKEADDHVKNYDQTLFQHQIAKKKWINRLIDMISDYPKEKFLRLIGVYIIFQVLCYHFKIDFSSLEMLLLCLSLGFIL